MAESAALRSHIVDGAIDLLAGTAGGIACVYSGQPLDTVKVKMQTFSHLYSGSGQCLLQTWKKEGIRGLYAGTVPALAANVAENAILFCAYGYMQKLVAGAAGKKVERLGAVENALSGSAAAVFSSFALCPTELVKCRLQVPGYFFFFGGYELSRAAFTPIGKTKDDIGVLRTAVSGGVGGTSLWVAIFPADVIKSQVQVQGGGAFMPTAREIVAKNGFRGLYAGLAPTVVRSFFATGCLFVAYEWTKKALHSLHQ